MKAWLICGQSLIFGSAIGACETFVVIKEFVNFAVQHWNCALRMICYRLRCRRDGTNDTQEDRSAKGSLNF